MADRQADPCLGPGGSLAQQVLELGEDLLDRVEIRGIFWQEQQLGTGLAEGLANPWRLWLCRLSALTRSPGRKVGTSTCST